MASQQNESKLDLPVSTEEEDYEQLLDDYSHLAPPHEGELLQWHVLKVTDKESIVDFGYKSEGLDPIEQFTLPDGSITVRSRYSLVELIDQKVLQLEGYIIQSHMKVNI